jgi:hypothetical protein
MTIQERILPFINLGKFLQNLSSTEFQSLALDVANENPWFTSQNVRLALEGVTEFLDEKKLSGWVAKYSSAPNSKIVALVLAGNIPLVGFHDFLSVLIAGHHVQLKLSSKDKALMQFVIQKLIEFEPRFQARISVVDRLQNFDAVIATGSDNSARYFEYYFGKYPHIIRKNRTSVAVLTGDETREELTMLG